jgi:hypothetical protein
MRPARPYQAVVIALYVNAMLLVVLVLVLAGRGGATGLMPAAFGQSQPPIAGGAGVFVMPAQLNQNTWGCYLLDVDTQTLAVYSYSPGERLLRLLAARSIRHDRRLQNFNTDSPSPQEVMELVEREQSVGRAGGPGGVTPPAHQPGR